MSDFEEKLLSIDQSINALVKDSERFLDANQSKKVKRELLNSRDRIRQVKETIGNIRTNELEREAGRKKLISDKVVAQYKEKLNLLMQIKKPHLNAKLTLNDLSAYLNVTANQMSYILNKGFGQNFAEFVNLYRVNTFIQMHQDPKNNYLSVLGLAYESGFNSKTTFNTFFKKTTGKTPSSYCKQNDKLAIDMAV